VKLYKEADDKQRKAFIEEIAQIPKENIVYVDETGVEQENSSTYGYSLRGKKIVSKVSGKRKPRINIVSGKQGDKVIGTAEFSGTMKSHRFETWFTLFFLPLLIAGTVIIMDNARFHRKTVLQALAMEQGCRIIFLPPYSPDLNPIEKLWANLKNFLRLYMKNFNSVYDAIWNYFKLD
jgi:transposase